MFSNRSAHFITRSIIRRKIALAVVPYVRERVEFAAMAFSNFNEFINRTNTINRFLNAFSQWCGIK